MNFDTFHVLHLKYTRFFSIFIEIYSLHDAIEHPLHLERISLFW